MATTKIPDRDAEFFAAFDAGLQQLIQSVTNVLEQNSHELHSDSQEKGEKLLLTGDFVPSMVSDHRRNVERHST